jgi:hypothetical protein
VSVRRLGRYQLGEVIGVGTFATVHRAFDERLDDVVVAKVLAENHSLNPELRGRFIGEGRSLRRIDDPHVIRAYDIGETDRQQPYLILEFADRGTLAERVRRLRATQPGWVPAPADVLAVARSLAAALRAVHAAGLVHRDLSPGNVLLSSARRDGPGDNPGHPPAMAVIVPDEKLLLADLGMCKDLALNSGLTVAGGTDGFRPPEQRGGPATVDTRADLWAASALMVWLCTDRRGDRIAVPKAFAAAGLPARWGQVFERSLATEPARRHRGIDEWIADVESAVRGPRDVLAAATARPSRRRRWMWPVAVATALALGVAAGVAGSTLLTADGPGWQVHDEGGGTVRAVDTAGSDRIAITGPHEIDVAQEATYRVTAVGVQHWVVTMPDGRFLTDQAEVRVRATSPGVAELGIRSRTGGGSELLAVLPIEVRGP